MPRPLDVAERALAMLDGEGLVTVSDSLVVVVAIRDGRAGRAEGPGTEEGDLRRLGKAAWLRAGQMRAWRVPALPPATVGEVDRGGPIREAVASTWGTRTYETRFAEPTQNRPTSGSGWVRLEDGSILGPQAVAELLRALAPVYGVDLALGGSPPAASPAVTLVDDGTEVRSFDAEGTARQRTLVVDGGRFVQGVRDSAAGRTTGHATRPLTLAPRADHLRLLPTTGGSAQPDVGTLGPLRSAEARALLERVVEVGG